MTYKCDWPPFEMTTSQPFSDNWAVADNEAGEGCVPFLPHDVLVCPKHSEMLEEIICNPELLDRETEPTLARPSSRRSRPAPSTARASRRRLSTCATSGSSWRLWSGRAWPSRGGSRWPRAIAKFW